MYCYQFSILYYCNRLVNFKNDILGAYASARTTYDFLRAMTAALFMIRHGSPFSSIFVVDVYD